MKLENNIVKTSTLRAPTNVLKPAQNVNCIECHLTIDRTDSR